MGEVAMATEGGGGSMNPVISVTAHVVTGTDSELDHQRITRTRRISKSSSNLTSAAIPIPNLALDADMGSTALAHSFPGLSLETPEFATQASAQLGLHGFFGRGWSTPSGPSTSSTPTGSTGSRTPETNLDERGAVVPLPTGNTVVSAGPTPSVPAPPGPESSGFSSYFSTRFFSQPRPPLSARELNMLSIGK